MPKTPAAAALLLAALTSPAGAVVPPVVEPGRVIDPVVCAADPTLSYALYLPSGDDPGRAWPILYLFDSEGRGAGLLERFRAAAQRWGFALAASNSAESDTPWEVNQRAVRILMADVFRHVSVDPQRLHFGGFSGTARLAWAAGTGFRDAVGGVLLLGGGTPDDELPGDPPPYPVFAAAGTEDFNYLEVRRLAETLAALEAPYRATFFDGGNVWPPEEVVDEALGWFVLRATLAGRAPADETLIERLLTTDLARAREAEEGGELLAALDRYRAIGRDYGGLGEPGDLAGVAEARAAAERLAASPQMRQAQAEERKGRKMEEVYRSKVAAAVSRVLRDKRPPQPARLEAELEVKALRARMKGGDPADARAAHRMLERAFLHTSFYLPQRFFRRLEPRRAAASLTVAVAIHDDRPELWYELARAQALSGKKAEALEALARAVEHGFTDRERLEAEEAFEPLRKEEAYQALLPEG